MYYTDQVNMHPTMATVDVAMILKKKSRVRAVQVTVNSDKYDSRLIIYSISSWTSCYVYDGMVIEDYAEVLVLYDNDGISVNIDRLGLRRPGVVVYGTNTVIFMIRLCCK